MTKHCIKIQKPKGKWNGIFLCGEAPGKDEERTGKPFVGASGQVLNAWLEGAGIDRSECYTSNVFHIRPENNKINTFFISARMAQEQSIDYDARLPQYMGEWVHDPYDQELYRLRDEVRTYKPPVIVSIGKVALWACTGHDEYKGHLYTFTGCRLRKKSIVMPIYHPAYWMRGRDEVMEYQIVEALKQARKRAKRAMQ